ncbi:MAG: hypothetical protein U1E26_07705 [Coriobacteriia bacterium]|nr:hypothetical protein [Coriobacteriia bacterium]
MNEGPSGNNRQRNVGAGIGSVTFWIGMAALLVFFGYLGWQYWFGG